MKLSTALSIGFPVAGALMGGASAYYVIYATIAPSTAAGILAIALGILVLTLRLSWEAAHLEEGLRDV